MLLYGLTLSLPRVIVINIKIPLQPHSIERTWLFIAYSDER